MKTYNMKKIIILLLAIVTIPFFQSCDEDRDDVRQPEFYNATLAEEAILEFIPSNDDETNAFQYNFDLKTGNAFWAITDIEFDVNLILGGYAASDVSKIELYLFAEEKNGETYKYLGGDQGKLFKTINSPSDTFKVSFSKDDLANLFASDFSPDHDGDILTDDLFEVKWVITAKDGSILDTRTDCYGDFNCSYGFGTKVVYVDTWVGEFQYNWTFASPATITYSWGKVGANPTGTVLFSESGTDGQYNIDDLSCGGAYGSAAPGYVTYDGTTNTLTVFNDGTAACNWELVSRTPETLTINWTYRYTASYGEYGTFEITRNDGLTWPENLIIVNN